jgi:xanthine dehydrogenase molybdenum-binding subunit
MSTQPSALPFAIPPTRSISFTVNGRPVTVEVDPKRTLLDVLREELNITSPKNGCAPQAQCGCCTVVIDGKAKLSCALAVEKIEGKSILTLEGVEQQKREQLSECFVRAGGLQCGFCIPGFVVRGMTLVDEKPNPTRQEIAAAIRPHLCRCTGYTKIIDAIEMYARVRQGEPLPALPTQGGVGTRLNRYRGHAFALGDWNYIDDIKVDGMLYAAMRFADHPRAKLNAIDITPAMAVRGVQRIITAEDIPGERYIGLIYKDWPLMVALGEETRYVGDVIAIVVADDQHTAREAARLIEVDYEVLTPLSTPEMSLAPDAPKIHPKGNLLSTSAIKRGDAAAALANSAFVYEDHFETQRIEHMFLEPESSLAMPWSPEDEAEHQGNGHGNGEGNGHQHEHPTGVRVLSQGQGVFDDQRQIAAVLGWDKDRVRVELISNGGAFGGKEDLSIQGQTALAAVLVNAPVKCTLTREESIRVHPKRHPIKIHMKLGCDAEGHLTGMWARMIGDKGAYASVGTKVVERAAGHATGPYRLPAVDIEALAVYTNNPPCGAMRGFGANQSSFAVEQCLNQLAAKVGINQWEIRSRNILELGDAFCTGQRLVKPFGLRKTLEAVKEQFLAAKYAGIACGIKNVGIGNGMPDEGKAIIVVEAPDRISIRTGFTEMGQGYFTIQIQVAVEETGLSPDLFKPTTDTSVDVNCMQTTASRATVLGSAAIMDACKKLKADLDAAGGDVAKLVGKTYSGYYGCLYTTKLGADVPDPKTHLTYGFATQVVILDDDGRLKKVIAAHDVGRVMNPTLLEGQMQGSIHMGLGYALTEELPTQDSQLVSKQIKDLGILRAQHMPELELIFIEENDPETPYGSRGVGEIGLVPTAPAVAGALQKFDGILRKKLPMKDSPAAQAILNPAWKPAKRA